MRRAVRDADPNVIKTNGGGHIEFKFYSVSNKYGKKKKRGYSFLFG